MLRWIQHVHGEVTGGSTIARVARHLHGLRTDLCIALGLVLGRPSQLCKVDAIAHATQVD
jgi:hypothetical protein